MSRAQGARSLLAGAFETIYGTVPEDGFIQLPFISTTLGSEQPLIEDDILGLGRDPADPGRDGISVTGDVVVPIDLRNFPHWLKLLFGAPTTTGVAGAYVHTFGSGSWALPSLSAEIGFPEIPYYPMVSGIRANTLQFQQQRSGLASATIGCIAQGETPATETAAGVPSTAVIERFNQFQGAIRKDGAALANIVSSSVNYTNNLDPVETVRADGKIDGVDPGKAAMTGSFTARFADTALIDAATTGTPMELEFAFTISAAKALILTVHRVFLPKPKVGISGPGGIQATFDWRAAKASGGTNRMCTAVVKNDVASYA